MLAAAVMLPAIVAVLTPDEADERVGAGWPKFPSPLSRSIPLPLLPKIELPKTETGDAVTSTPARSVLLLKPL